MTSVHLLNGSCVAESFLKLCLSLLADGMLLYEGPLSVYQFWSEMSNMVRLMTYIPLQASKLPSIMATHPSR